VFKGQAWYLYGFCREKKDMRYFKITRMKALLVLEECFHPSTVTKPAAEAAAPKPIETVELLLQVDKEMAYRIYDEFPADTIEKLEDGNFLVHARLQSGSWLMGYLMSYEDHLKILDPPQLRNELIQKYQNALLKITSQDDLHY
jgi:predicted DNA-binding transcriptional regulator YafY